MKYSILMPYLFRAKHLHNTLTSFRHHYKDRNDYEVVIMEDAKNAADEKEHLALQKVIALFKNDIEITQIIAGSPDCWNPAPLFNAGAREAKGEYFIITNPEGFHKTDVLKGLDCEFGKDTSAYVVCACESHKQCTFDIEKYEDYKGNFHTWYQHSIHNNKRYHWCSAISKENWHKIGGFDERFGLGFAYDDDDFIASVKASGAWIVTRDDLITVHMEHGKGFRPKNLRVLLKRNHALYEEKWKTKIAL